MKKSNDSVELQYFTFEPLGLLKESVNHFVESQDSLPQLAKSVVAAVTAIELAVKRDLVSYCPALILNKIDEDGGNVIALFELQQKVVDEEERREIKTAEFHILLKRLNRFKNFARYETPLNNLRKIRNSLIHHEAYMDIAAVNYHLTTFAYPFLKSLLSDKPGKDFFATDIWLRIEALKDSKANEFELALHKKLALHAGKKCVLSPVQRALIRRLQSQTLDYMDEEVVSDNLLCPACTEPTFACISGVEPGDGPDGEMMYQYTVFRCRMCELELDLTQILYLAEHLTVFNLAEQKDKAQEWISASGWTSAQEVFDPIVDSSHGYSGF